MKKKLNGGKRTYGIRLGYNYIFANKFGSSLGGGFRVNLLTL